MSGSKFKDLSKYCCMRSCGLGENLLFRDETDFSRLILLLGNKTIEGVDTKLIAYNFALNKFSLLLNCNSKFNEIILFNEVLADYDKYYYDKYKENTNIALSDLLMSEIDSPDELLAVSRQIHTDPDNWLECSHSSLRAYLYDDTPDFLDKTHITSIYGSAVEYFEFLNQSRQLASI